MVRALTLVMIAAMWSLMPLAGALGDKRDAIFKEAANFARSVQISDLAKLEAWLSDATILAKLDTKEAYYGPAVHLRVASVVQLLAENSAPRAKEALLFLTTSQTFLEHRKRVELLIQALVNITPAPAEALEFWEKHFQPEDGYTPITVWALLNNGSEPAIALFENKMKDANFPETEREYWLKAEVLQRRNDLPLLQACDRLLDSSLEERYRLLLIDVLFDYKPDDWYGAGYRYKPPPREHALAESLEQLRILGQKSLKSQPLSKTQKDRINMTLKEIERLVCSGCGGQLEKQLSPLNPAVQ